MNIVLFSRPVHSGKTTELQAWCAGRGAVQGILMPDIAGQRYFEVIGRNERWPIDAAPNEDLVNVGPYRFSQGAVDRALASLTSYKERPRWLVVDEIGKWELSGGGFTPLFDRLDEKHAARPETLLLVVRDTLVAAVIERFGLQNPHVLPALSEL